MNRKYEIAFLLREGDPGEQAIGRIKENLEKHKSSVVKDDKMGLRDLAYEIRKKREKFHRAMYYFVKADAHKALEQGAKGVGVDFGGEPV